MQTYTPYRPYHLYDIETVRSFERPRRSRISYLNIITCRHVPRLARILQLPIASRKGMVEPQGGFHEDADTDRHVAVARVGCSRPLLARRSEQGCRASNERERETTRRETWDRSAGRRRYGPARGSRRVDRAEAEGGAGHFEDQRDHPGEEQPAHRCRSGRIPAPQRGGAEDPDVFPLLHLRQRRDGGQQRPAPAQRRGDSAVAQE